MGGIFAHYNIRVQIRGHMRQKWNLAQQGASKNLQEHMNRVWAAGAWNLWHERNRRLFSYKRNPVFILINDTTTEILFCSHDRKVTGRGGKGGRREPKTKVTHARGYCALLATIFAS